MSPAAGWVPQPVWHPLSSKKYLPLQKIECWLPGPRVCRLVRILTDISRLHLVPKLRVHGTIPTIPHTLLWHLIYRFNSLMCWNSRFNLVRKRVIYFGSPMPSDTYGRPARQFGHTQTGNFGSRLRCSESLIAVRQIIVGTSPLCSLVTTQHKGNVHWTKCVDQCPSWEAASCSDNR